MNFQNNNSNFTQDGFNQYQGVPHIFTTQVGGTTYFHRVAPTTGSGFSNQQVIWPEYQPQQNHGLLSNSTSLPQFLPVTEIPVFNPITPQGNHGTTLQNGAVALNPQLQGPVMFVDAMGQQHGTSVTFHPQLQAPNVAVGGGGPQYGVPVPNAPHMQAPIMYVSANGQQHGTAVPFGPQLQAPFRLMNGRGPPHGTSLPSTQYLQAPLMPMAATGQQHGTAVLFNPTPAPSVPVQLIDNLQLPSIEQLAAGPSSTGLMTPAAPMVQLPVQQSLQKTKAPAEVALCVSSGVTTESLKPQATTSMTVEEVKRPQAGEPKAQIEPQQPGTSSSEGSLVVKPRCQDGTKRQQPHGAMVEAEAKPADKNTSTKQALKTPAPVEAGQADANLPKKPKSSLPESADTHKDKPTKKRKHDKGEKEKKEKRKKKETGLTKSGEEGSDTNQKVGVLKAPEDQSKAKHKDSSKKSKSKKAKEMQPADGLQPKSKLGERIVHSVQVFHKLGEKIEKVKPPKPTPVEAAKTSQSERPSCSGWQREKPKIPYRVQPYTIPKVHRSSNVLDHSKPSNMPERPGPSNAPDRAPVCSNADQPRRPEHSQSGPSAPAPERRAQRPPAPAQPRQPREVPHFFKNHAYGSVGDYGDGERILYPRPEYPGMFPRPLSNLPAQAPGAPRRFHCRETSVPIPDERRAEREAMKREAQRQREEAAKITRNGMDCSALADRMNRPHELWPREANWSESELDEVWNLD